MSVLVAPKHVRIQVRRAEHPRRPEDHSGRKVLRLQRPARDIEVRQVRLDHFAELFLAGFQMEKLKTVNGIGELEGLAALPAALRVGQEDAGHVLRILLANALLVTQRQKSFRFVIHIAVVHQETKNN